MGGFDLTDIVEFYIVTWVGGKFFPVCYCCERGGLGRHSLHTRANSLSQ